MSETTAVNINVPVFFWKHMLAIARNAMSTTQDILIGGLVTRIATKCGIPDVDIVSNECLLTLQHLSQCGYIVEGAGGNFRWKIYPQPYVYIDMPTDALPPLAPNLQHYLFPQALPPHLQEAVLQGGVHQQAQGQPQGYTPFEQLMIDNFAQMQLAQQQTNAHLAALDTRLSNQENWSHQFETQTQTAFRPILDYHYTQGHFHEDVVFPPWYRPPSTTWGGDMDQDDDADDDPPQL